MEVKNLTVNYSKQNALNDVSLTIENKNKIFGILGQNGSGKTTLIDVIVGRINSYSGQTKIPESISYMPDRFFLYEDMTVKQSIELFKQAFSDFNSARAHNILHHFKINDDLKLHSASKGIHEQIHLALILARDVDFYIMDEPLSAIDPINRAAFIQAIENYRRKNSSVIIVTHLIRDLGDMLDQIIFMKEGKFLIQDTKEYFINKYGSLEKAYFEEISKKAI